MKKPTLTLDTSCLISMLQLPGDSTPQEEVEFLLQIQKWGKEKQIDLYISEKTKTESQNNLENAINIDPNNISRIKKWVETLKLLNNYQITEGRWVNGISKLGVDTTLGTESEGNVFENMSELLFNKTPSYLNLGNLMDLAIFFEHYITRNDFFVTRDLKNNMINKKNEIELRWKIVVCTPKEVVSILRFLFLDG